MKNRKQIAQLLISAVILLLLAAYLWAGHGIKTVDMQNMPKPEQYWSTTLTDQDVLMQNFSSDESSLRGIMVYPLFEEEDLAGEESFLHVAIWDPAEPDAPLELRDVSFRSLSSAEWNYVPLPVKLMPGHSYTVTYNVSGAADSGISIVLYSAEEQNSFAPYLHCDHAFRNGEELEGCILQNVLIAVPVNGAVNLVFFLCAAMVLAGIFAAGNRDWLRKCVPARLRFPVDRGFWQALTGHFLEICIGSLILLSAYLRWSLVPYVSGDLSAFLEPWVEHYRQLGIADGLMNMPGDYYVPYNLLLALTAYLPGSTAQWLALYACIADYVIAFFAGKICTLLLQRKNDSHAVQKGRMAGCLVLFLPPVFMDSAAWKQADTIYICFLIIMIYELLKNRYAWAFLFWGISLAFKLQAVFLLPVLIILWLYRKCRLWHFLIPVVVFVLAGLPAVFMGADPAYIYGKYFQQTQEPVLISVLFPNFYYLGLYHDALRTAGIVCAAAAFIFSAWYLKQRYSGVSDKMLLHYAVWSVWTCVMFLPSMHQRYDIVLVVLLLILSVSVDHRMIPFLLVSVMCCTITMGNYLFLPEENHVPETLLAAVYCSAYLGYTVSLLLRGPESRRMT